MPRKKTTSAKKTTSKKTVKSLPSTSDQYEECDFDQPNFKILQRFIDGTVHEVQQPLKSIAERMTSLIEEYKDRDFEYVGYKEYQNIFETLALIKDQLNYCSETTGRLIDISKKEIGATSTKCDINAVVREVKTLFSQTVKLSDVQVVLKLATKLPLALIASSDFSQALVNVMTNAIQSMPAGGKLEIKTSCLKGSDLIVVECRDEGIGISKETLPHVFDPFFTTKERGLHRNSGLGLAMVSSIIGRYKGKVELKSSLRNGTKVFLKIPATKNEHA